MTPADHRAAVAVLKLARRALDVAEHACHRAEARHDPRALAAATAAVTLAATWQHRARTALDVAAPQHSEVNT